MKILLAYPRGFCAGVVMAIESLERALGLCGGTLYVFHEIVHNKHVVEEFSRRGVVFVDDVEAVPEGSYLLYSAHGVSPEVRQKAQNRRLRTIDATCPLVTKVHAEVIRYAGQGYTIILIGHEGHDEAVGTVGEAPNRIRIVETVEDVDRLLIPATEKLAYVMQTTLSVDDAACIVNHLKKRFPDIVGPPKNDICYASQNRQQAVKSLLPKADTVLVIGSQNSSNSNRLSEIAQAYGKPAHLIDGVGEIESGWFQHKDTVLITAGASAPEEVVQQCVAYLRDRYDAEVLEEPLLTEHIRFPLPLEIRSVDGIAGGDALVVL